MTAASAAYGRASAGGPGGPALTAALTPAALVRLQVRTAGAPRQNGPPRSSRDTASPSPRNRNQVIQRADVLPHPVAASATHLDLTAGLRVAGRLPCRISQEAP